MSDRQINRRALLAASASALAACGLVSAAAAQGTDPAARIRSFYATLLDTMKQGKQLGTQGRYQRLAPAVLAAFDVAGMTRTAAGPGWDQTSPAQQTALTEAFAHMMTATYASRFSAFSGETFEVLSVVDQPPAKVVKTRLVPSSGEAVALDYRMRSAADGWKIADVQVNGSISELAIRRSEFGSIMRSRGPDALVTSLRQKGDQLLRGA